MKALLLEKPFNFDTFKFLGIGFLLPGFRSNQEGGKKLSALTKLLTGSFLSLQKPRIVRLHIVKFLVVTFVINFLVAETSTSSFFTFFTTNSSNFLTLF